ncbi:MAG: flavodoxin family protein, partial [Deltaproteobacteria bacterium]|nr:flavodoxin family protein [Deltaproteobacteria bacterium]
VSAGAGFETVTLARLKITPCHSCGTCNSPDHFLRCIFEEKDDVAAIFSKMAAADLLVFATPIYIFTMTALMKIFLERMYARADVFDLSVTQSGLVFHHVDRDLNSKPFAVLVCCDNIEKETPKNVVSYFRTHAKFNDAEQVGLLVRNAGRYAGHGGDPEAARSNPLLAQVYEAFERAGKELATQGRIRKATEKEAAANIIPMPPIFKLLRRFRFFKEKMVHKAMETMKYTEGAV